MWKDFKEFAIRGNVIDLAIGILIGGAFAPIAKSLVDDVIMPPIGLLLGRVNFSELFLLLKEGKPPGPYASVAAAKAAGAVTVNYGLFINAIVTFLIIVFIAFLIVRFVNALRRRQEGTAPAEPTTKSCPYCLSTIPIKATRCPSCTSDLREGTAA
ncbi:MAG TPA: large conductance mechanosensitive channel protein MscL [Thermoanaerobaculia bacterium]|nr:large conductance mechanosensitive channel protein MscL [Thermoanaerobaculia bacterium]